MSLVTANWKPDNRQLRQFGLLCAIALPLLAWLWSATWWSIGGLAVLGIVIAAVAWWRPPAVAPLFVSLMLVTLPIGMVLSEVVLLLVYVGVFLPMGLVFRWTGRDRLQRKLDHNRDSYWEEKAQPRSLASYYRQS